MCWVSELPLACYYFKDEEMSFRARLLAKMVGSSFIAGGDDAVSALAASVKADHLNDLLQHYYMARGEEYDGSDISLTDVKKAIIYVRDKKETKAMRRAAVGATKAGLHVAATAGGLTVGSVVPGLGNALGAAGGYVVGGSLAPVVTVLDRLKRTGKGIYKSIAGTRGVHRKQAAEALMACRIPECNLADGSNPADDALLIILGSEYQEVVANNDISRLADRMKSN